MNASAVDAAASRFPQARKFTDFREVFDHAKAFDAVYGGTVPDLAFTALTDTRFYGLNYNIPSLCFGASGAAMHGFNEYVDLESLRKSTRATALFIAEWCGVEPI